MSVDARISTALPSHPKTKKLARRLGPAGPLACIYLFLWAAANRPDGDLSGMSDEDIELAVDWSGDEGAFVAAMIDVGFIDEDEGARKIHDWAEHNPWAAGSTARSEKARWAALCKKYGRQEAGRMMPEYAERMNYACDEDATSTPESATSTPLARSSSAPSPSPSPSPKQDQDQEPLRSPPSGSRLPADWTLPDTWRQWASDKRPDLDVQAEADGFADYWHGVAGAKARKADWQATWRNWIRNASGRPKPRLVASGGAALDAYDLLMRSAL